MILCRYPEIPVAGRLKFFLPQWKKITNDQWVLSIIREGLKLDFLSIPPFSGVRETHVDVQKLPILLQEVKKLLEKNAIEPVPLHDMHRGFYSTFFLVPKKSGDLRPVINLRPFNRYLRKQHFKMDSLNSVLNLVQPGDWAISLDLKDAYMHLPIYSSHKRYLRFCIQGKAYQFTCLCFGPTMAPRIFTKVVAVVAAHLRMQNLRLAVYLDDWFLVNLIKEMLIMDKKESTQSPSGTRFHDKFRKIGSRAKPVSCLHRGTFFVSKRPGLPNSGKNRKDKGSLQAAEKMSNSSKLPSFARTDGILHRTSSQCKIVHETNTVAPVTFLETVNNGPTDGSSIQQKCTATSKILAKQRQLVEREKFLCAKQLKNSDDRCIQVRLRRSLTESNLPGNLVYARGKKAHQLARTKGSISDHQTFSATSERSHSVDSIRQHNSCSVLEQGRGNSVTPVVLSDMGHMASSKSQQHCSEISPLGWSSECFGRQFEQSKNKTNRVVFEQCSSPQIVSDLGNTSDRSFRFRSKQENTSVLHMVSQSTGPSNRCIVNCMGKHGSICFSPNLSHSKSATAHEEIPMSDNTHSPTMAKETLVYQSPSNVNSMSKEVTTQTRSSVPTEDQNLSPKTRDIQSDCMAIVNQSFQNKGFSDDTRKLMVASWRSGTRRDYSVKFKKFNSWCTERKIDPHAATLTNCADFLSSLFQVGLKYRTISGYRSMLSVMLPQINGYPVGQHPDIIRLLKGVFNSRPPVKQLVPEWDLKKILELLSNPPFEPMNKISLKCLTWKTIFLTAISTFRRCSDLQALRCDAGFMNILPEGVIFIREGLSKQDRPSHNCKKIFVPCFKKNRKLDPKRAVEIYVKRTSEFRSSSEMEMIRQLFLTINKPHKAASRQTIASWIVSLIKLAYSDSESEINVRAHSTRAIGPSWALFKGASLSDILDAADWSSDATFKSYYYREMDAPSWEL